MSKLFSNMTTQKKLGLLALILGFFAVFAGSPYETNKITINAKDLALMAQKDVDNVSVQQVADWIIKGNFDFRIIDTRSPKEYADYHIPMAQNIQLSALLNQNFYPTDKLILYSDNSEKATQAWLLLKAKKFKNVYILKDGLNAWKDKILFPKMPANPSEGQMAEFNKIKEVSKFFGGTPQTGKRGEQEQKKVKKMPKLKLPAAIPQGAPHKKRREGC
ncbi:MAG TPA: rhodanese-like domain-containing protein [Balneolales bacterium]|nr:rhodanese-like domain-containing protein [Balneolales bacterium]